MIGGYRRYCPPMSPLLLLLPTALAAPPDTPSLVQPADGDQHVAVPPTLTVHATDPDGDPLTVSLEVRPLWEPGEDFTLVALPDTQYYACGCNGGLPETFSAQTAWVVEALATRDIVFVTQLGDCVENGDAVPEEWEVADAAFTLLEDPVTTGLEEGVPYGIAVGNHDQSPAGDPDGATAYYNATFGVDRFAGRSWYGGHRGDDNDDHYQLFEAGHTGYVILHLEYDPAPSEEDLAWAVGVLEEHADRLAIVVSHHLIGTDGAWGAQGAATWEALRDQPNLLLMLSGHVPGVGRRSDTSGERTVHTLLADYQMEANGGDGWLRLLTFSPAPRGIAPERGLVTVETWSPTRGEYDTSPENAFVLEADLSPPFAPVGEPVAVSSGETAPPPAFRGGGGGGGGPLGVPGRRGLHPRPARTELRVAGRGLRRLRVHRVAGLELPGGRGRPRHRPGHGRRRRHLDRHRATPGHRRAPGGGWGVWLRRRGSRGRARRAAARAGRRTSTEARPGAPQGIVRRGMLRVMRTSPGRSSAGEE